MATFANAPQDADDDGVAELVTEDIEAAADPADEAEPAVADATESSADVDASGPSEDAAAADESADDAGSGGAGVGVMDPDAVGRSADLPVEEGVAASVHRETAAARFLRTIAPWALADHDDKDHESHAS